MDRPRFIKACRLEQVDRIPLWFMRQAGRYMEVYRRLRQDHTLLEICRTPELAAEVTFQPIRRFDLDAAIIFADILLPLPHLGVDFDFVKGEGPTIFEPIRTAGQVEHLKTFEPREGLSSVLDAIRLVRTDLDDSIALIGFAGAPFTLASYMIEGGSSRHFVLTKLFMYQQEAAWHSMMEKIAQVTVSYLRAQVEAGADVLQLFDSWVGSLDPDDYRRYVFPYSKFVLSELRSLGVPLIHFGTGTLGLLDQMRDAGATVVGVDWRVDIDQAWKTIGFGTAVQGNLDPVALMGPRDKLLAKVKAILDRVGDKPGFIFNLGHGILPETPEENVEAVVELVHSYGGRI